MALNYKSRSDLAKEPALVESIRMILVERVRIILFAANPDPTDEATALLIRNNLGGAASALAQLYAGSVDAVWGADTTLESLVGALQTDDSPEIATLVSSIQTQWNKFPALLGLS